MIDSIIVTLLVACLAALIVLVFLVRKHHQVFRDGLATNDPLSPFLIYGGSVREDLRKAAENSRRLSEGITGLRDQLLSRFDQRQQAIESASETHRLLSQVIARNEKSLADLRDGQAWVQHRALLEGVFDSVRVLRFQEPDSTTQALARLSSVLEAAGVREIPEADLVGRLVGDVAAQVRPAQERIPRGPSDVPDSVHSVAEPGFEIDLGIAGQAPRVVVPALVRIFSAELGSPEPSLDSQEAGQVAVNEEEKGDEEENVESGALEN